MLQQADEWTQTWNAMKQQIMCNNQPTNQQQKGKRTAIGRSRATNIKKNRVQNLFRLQKGLGNLVSDWKSKGSGIK